MIMIVVVALVISCAFNSFAMQMNWVPKQAAARTGVMEPDDHTPKAFKPDKQDVAYPDFWLVDGVPSDGAGYTSSIDTSKGENSVRFPSPL
jgi:hypothetical protein